MVNLSVKSAKHLSYAFYKYKETVIAQEDRCDSCFFGVSELLKL